MVITSMLLGYTPHQRNPYYIGLLQKYYYQNRDPRILRALLQALREAKTQTVTRQSADNLQVMVMDQLEVHARTNLYFRKRYLQ